MALGMMRMMGLRVTGGSVGVPSFLSRRYASGEIVVDNPYSEETFCTLKTHSLEAATEILEQCATAQKEWKETDLSTRLNVCREFLDDFDNNREKVAQEISGQMGKPLKYSHGEINGMFERAEAMMEMAPKVLADEVVESSEGALKKITKEPVGTVLVLAPWNYPLLTAVNAVVPAVLAGNAVAIKHSNRTPLCADHFSNSFMASSAPKGLVQSIHSDHDVVHKIIENPIVSYVSFTGSVEGGQAVYSTVGKSRFIDTTLELGGKDGAYVAPDCDPAVAAEGLVDGAMFNAGQSCCGIERVYVHESIYEQFLAEAKQIISGYNLGDPFSPETNMGPMAQPSSIGFLDEQVTQALADGARLLCGGAPCADSSGKGRFFEPTLLADCTHSMSVMTEESFGPILAVAPVKDDEEAIEKMNDCKYGLTAAIFTQSQERAQKMAPKLEAGTIFMNRCDYLDPYLPWTGVKDTGKGVSLSTHGFRGVTRLKGYNFKL